MRWVGLTWVVVCIHGLVACSSDENPRERDRNGSGGSDDGGASTGGAGAGGRGGAGGNGGSSGASGSGGTSGAPFGECGSAVGCSGVLCVDPENAECTDAGCLFDQRNGGFEFYCTRACNSDDDCPSGFLCLTANVAGDGTRKVCARYLPECGNEILDPDEACDDGNTEAGDGCSADCGSDETCGNGVTDPGEVCDDANTAGGDGCSTDCLSDETCGNGILDTGEDCDDHNLAGEDGCEPDCTVTGCGNGHPTEPEACDEMAPGCDNQCRIVPVDGFSELSRYPNEQPFSTTTFVAAGSGERLFASWTDGPSIPGTRVSIVSTDAGDHFQTRRTVGLSARVDERLLRGTTGNLLVLWAPDYGKLYLRRSADLGASWGDVETVDIPTLQTLQYYDMVAAGSHFYLEFVGWNGTTYSNWLVHSADAGVTWGDPVRVDDGTVVRNACGFFGIAATVGGRVAVKTCFGTRWSDDFGANFHDIDLTSPLGADSLALDIVNVIDLGGGAWLAPSGRTVYRSIDDFESWTETELVTSFYGQVTQVSRNPDGTLYWAWCGPLVSQGDLELLVRRSDNDGVDWTEPATVATFPGHMGAGTCRAGIVSAPSGTYAWWVGNEMGSDEYAGYFRMARTRDGETFDPAISLTPSNGSRPVPNTPAFVIDSIGGLHVFFGQSTTLMAYGYVQRHRLLP